MLVMNNLQVSFLRAARYAGCVLPNIGWPLKQKSNRWYSKVYDRLDAVALRFRPATLPCPPCAIGGAATLGKIGFGGIVEANERSKSVF